MASVSGEKVGASCSPSTGHGCFGGGGSEDAGLFVGVKSQKEKKPGEELS